MGRGLWTTGGDTTDLTEYEKGLYAEWVEVETHVSYNHKTTTLVIKLHNGFEIVGTAGCEDPTKFSEELGRLYAMKDALRKLGEFVAFDRAQENHLGRASELRIHRVSPDVVEEIRKAVGEGMLSAMRVADPMRARF